MFRQGAQANNSGQKTVAQVKTDFVKVRTVAAVSFAFLAPLSAGTVSAADAHAIIEIETGYFFGGSEKGKWIKPEPGSKVDGQEDNLPGLRPNETDRSNHGRKTEICRRTVSGHFDGLALVETQGWSHRIGCPMERVTEGTHNR